jgi:hypothetical protein
MLRCVTSLAVVAVCLVLLAQGTYGQEADKTKPDVYGKITKVDGSGDALTLTVSSKKKGDAEATTCTVKTTKDTKVLLGAGKDKEPTVAVTTDLAVGKGVAVWLAAGKKTTAAKILIMGGKK